MHNLAERPTAGEVLILPRSSTNPALERHYTVAEIAKLWNISRQTLTKYFADEPGVLKHENTPSRYLRSYCTLRIPESVVIRVHTRLKR
ncbi:AraC-like DNA-binding protein [Silvibacterium bohemicum]|uniref:AraC-like DNA-binding protein n=1 Tax=Silvibacterium bohemicum TaxID=1577686 RepID=A0A841K264_9BACT|nr:helix-turn-helix domain-containing protein [Silvibacterium bohemicum]MBB6144738.1 AraC-like DNA-binding protein [Silvibacterium bohemicum]